MRIVRWVPGDEAGMRACCAASLASFAFDDPDGPRMSARLLRSYLEHPSEPAQTWYAEDGAAASGALATCHLRLPDRENTTRAFIYLDVHPEHRRRGIGSALLRHAARQAEQDGRTVLLAEVLQDSPGDAFARWAGASPILSDARRVQVLAKLPAGHVAALREDAARAAVGYSLLTWEGRTPDAYLSGLAGVFNALNDAPHDPGHEARIWDAERIREHVEGPRQLSGNRSYSLAAIHDETGELAAITEIAVDPEIPEWGMQLITAVIRQHRGHRLGLLVKAALLEWLAAAEPRLARVVTTNAATNEYMIAVNEALGYELLDPQPRSYELQVADVLRG